MYSLKGKNALVTGGGRGIGRAISLRLAAGGARVVLTYRTDTQSAEATVEKIKQAGGVARCIPLEVASAKSVDEAVAGVAAKEEKLHILVNNAGINNPTDFDKIEEEDWDKIMAVNLKGPFLCTQRFLPLLRAAHDSSVINIGSVSGQYGGPRTAHYAASKAGLISLGQVAARFGAPDGIRVNTLAVGLVASEMASSGLQSAAVQKASETILLKRMGTVEEIANAVAFLASDESSYITAQTININGGLYF
jgi:3-oxoacyl-[acyl-carrier protein] reductase